MNINKEASPSGAGYSTLFTEVLKWKKTKSTAPIAEILLRTMISTRSMVNQFVRTVSNITRQPATDAEILSGCKIHTETNGQQSIYNGLQYLKAHITYERNNVVLIHDGVRPVITEELITKSIRCTEQYGNSIAVSRAIETVIKVDDEGQIVETVDRDRCRNAKAPQCFILDEILEAHNRAIVEKRLNMIDSASLMSYYGYELHTVECSSENIKITTPNDYYMLLGMYQERGQL